jgi:hypothetical protein
MLFGYLGKRVDPATVARGLWRDYQRGGRSDLPECLRPYVEPADTRVVEKRRDLPRRQQRHISNP